MFKSIADIRKAMVVGSHWHTLHHGNGADMSKKDMETRPVSILQSGKFAFATVKADGTKADSWCDFPKKENVIFHDTNPASFTITEGGKPLLTYTMATAAPAPQLPAPPAEVNIKTTPATINPEPATDNKGEKAMTSTNATKKELSALSLNIIRIFALADSDPFVILAKDGKATIATIVDGIKEISAEFTTKDFAEATAPEFRFSAEDVATLHKIGIEPPQPKATRRTVVAGKKVRTPKGATTSAPKKDAYTRNHAFVEALKTGGTKKAIVSGADKLYRDKNPGTKEPTGKDPLFVSEAIFRYNIPSLLLLGVVQASADKEPVFTLTHDKL